MNMYFKFIVISMLSVCMIGMNSGCASAAVYHSSQKKVAMRKAMAVDNQKAIKDIQLGVPPETAGVPVTAGEAVSEQPWLQTGAAFIDALLGFGIYSGARAIQDSNSGGSSDNPSSNQAGQNTTVVKGDGNTVNVNGSGSNTGSGSVP